MAEANSMAALSSDVPPQPSLLTTKLYILPPHPDLVPRPHLTQRLNASLARKLILISAPAGFGKTTLLGEWIRQSEAPVAWVSLDDSDNDLRRFLSYVIAALQTAYVGIGEAALTMLQSPGMTRAVTPHVESLLITLINEIAAILDGNHDESDHEGRPFASCLTTTTQSPVCSWQRSQ